MACKHENFDASVGVHRFEDTGGFHADVKINCRDCGLPFQFLGIDPGLDIHGARCSLDGLELRIGLTPQGVVPNPGQRMAFGVRRVDA